MADASKGRVAYLDVDQAALRVTLDLIGLVRHRVFSLQEDIMHDACKNAREHIDS